MCQFAPGTKLDASIDIALSVINADRAASPPIAILPIARSDSVFSTKSQVFSPSVKASSRGHLDAFAAHSVSFTPTDEPTDTEFNITINTLDPLRMDTLNSTQRRLDLQPYRCQFSAPWFWGVFVYKQNRQFLLSNGYFDILDYIADDDVKDQPTKPDMVETSRVHLDALLHFVHDAQIRNYLGLSRRDACSWNLRRISISIEGQRYSLLFSGGSQHCEPLSLLKHIAHEHVEESKHEEAQATGTATPTKIHAIYFPKPSSEIKWSWYDERKQKRVDYDKDDELLVLEFEASYHANIQLNFPISNSLFASDANTSIFDHCYMPRLSKLRDREYCMRYTLSAKEVGYDLVMDQLNLRSKYARDVRREFDRQMYLRKLVSGPDSLSWHLSRSVSSVPPTVTRMHTESNPPTLEDMRRQSFRGEIAWIAIVDEVVLSE